MVRLVKGAYWDTEIKLAQVLGVDGYPVYTRKSATDVSYMTCAQALLAAGERIFPQFATHNCHTVAFILECVGERRAFEFQKLHGMGDALYDVLVPRAARAVPRLRAGRQPSRSACLPRAPSARERRQHVIRPPGCRQHGAARPAGGRPARPASRALYTESARAAAAARLFRPSEFARRRSLGPPGTAAARGQDRRGPAGSRRDWRDRRQCHQ